MTKTGKTVQQCLGQASEKQHKKISPSEWYSLLLLASYTSITSMIMRKSRLTASRTGKEYSPALAVLLGEILKLIISFSWATYRQGMIQSMPLPYEPHVALESKRLSCVSLESINPESISASTRLRLIFTRYQWKLRRVLQEIQKDNSSMAIPAILYVFQNILQIVATTFISALVYQGVTQLKLVLAAILSVVFLRKRLVRIQWCGIFLLLGGVCLISTDTSAQTSKSNSVGIQVLRVTQDKICSISESLYDWTSCFESIKTSSSFFSDIASWYHLLGLLCAFSACALGTLASIHLESKFKSHEGIHISIRNTQLSAFSIVTATVTVGFQYWKEPSWSPYDGFGVLAVASIISRALGGFIVSQVLSGPGTIGKGYATGLALFMTFLTQIAVGDKHLQLSTLTGCLLVLCSSFLYLSAPV